MQVKNYIKYILVLLSLFAFNCKYDKLDLNSITNSDVVSNGPKSDTVYIQQKLVMTGFNKPMDIIVGREPFIYVADTYNDRIVMLNIAGQKLGFTTIKHPIALAQDFQFNLLVCAQFDTTIQGNVETFSAVYKINLVAAGHNIASAPVTRILPLSNDFRYLNETRRREYTGICAFYDNSFYISRTGPSNDNLIDPDNCILMYGKTRSNAVKIDTLIGKVPLLAAEGTGLMSANMISSLTTLGKNNYDMIVTLTGGTSFKSQWFHWVETAEGAGYQSKLSPEKAEMMRVYRFSQPEDAVVDSYGNIFIADAKKDSVFKFNSFGQELQSFGGAAVFSNPHAVAVFDKTVYVADTDNDRILSFILSTDTN
ncbi:MAG: hypothetical protein ACM3RX_02750 [Methanococcaceae archaeon]